MAASLEYNPFSRYLDLRVSCPGCGTIQHLNVLTPLADFSQDSHNKSCEHDYVEEECENCGYVFEINMTTGIGGGDCTIENIDKKDLLDFHENIDDYDWKGIPDDLYSRYIDPHVMDIHNTLDKVYILDESSKKIIYRNLYAGGIAALEAYLSDTLISNVMKNDDFKRRFVENSVWMKNKKISLSELFKYHDQIDALVLTRLREIIYHRLKEIADIYKAVFQIEFPEFKELEPAIETRHDIVHRNGHDHNGKEVVITKEMVQDLLEKVSEFIGNIEDQLLSK